LKNIVDAKLIFVSEAALEAALFFVHGQKLTTPGENPQDARSCWVSADERSPWNIDVEREYP